MTTFPLKFSETDEILYRVLAQDIDTFPDYQTTTCTFYNDMYPNTVLSTIRYYHDVMDTILSTDAQTKLQLPVRTLISARLYILVPCFPCYHQL